jgi:formylglycine-generating enzyme required for sulfatase activity
MLNCRDRQNPSIYILLVITLTTASSISFAEEPSSKKPAYPQWDGKESITDYAKRAGLEPAQTLDLGSGVKLQVVLIPPGKFVMGNPPEPKDDGDIPVQRRVRISDDETPQHEVTLTRPHYMGKFLVTQEQYEKVVGANPSENKGATNPVEQVSWKDAQEFCAKLIAMSGRTVRLPTEAEWEHACRAGSTDTYFFDRDDDEFDPDVAPKKLTEHAWYCENSENKTHPVGQKKPNTWGLYDIHGNVSQWCQDWYGNFQKESTTDPQGPEQGTERVLRGGAYNKCHWFCWSAIRCKNLETESANSIGFRVLVDVAPKAP